MSTVVPPVMRPFAANGSNSLSMVQVPAGQLTQQEQSMSTPDPSVTPPANPDYQPDPKAEEERQRRKHPEQFPTKDKDKDDKDKDKDKDKDHPKPGDKEEEDRFIGKRHPDHDLPDAPHRPAGPPDTKPAPKR